MHIISIVGQKGGTGKTTLAECLAVAGVQDGLSVLVLDLDPQANAANWYDRREDKERPLVTTAPPGRLTQAIDAAKESGVDLVIIDTPGKLEGAALAAVEKADLVLIPVRPQINDLETLSASQHLLHSAGGRPALVILSAVPVAGKRHKEAAEFIKTLRIPVCPAMLSQRAAYGDAPSLGLAAQEFDPTGKAAEEIKQVYKFTKKLLKEIANNETRPIERLAAS
jgi:chromosome partitioning protein